MKFIKKEKTEKGPPPYRQVYRVKKNS